MSSKIRTNLHPTLENLAIAVSRVDRKDLETMNAQPLSLFPLLQAYAFGRLAINALKAKRLTLATIQADLRIQKPFFMVFIGKVFIRSYEPIARSQ